MIVFNPKMGGDPSIGTGVITDGSTYSLDTDGRSNAIAHTLSADGFDASEDGTGRGTPLVCVSSGQANAEISQDSSPALTCLHEAPIVTVAIRTAQTSANGHGIADDVAHTLDGVQGQAVAFSCKDSGQDATQEVSPTLRSMGHNESHPNAGGQMAVMHQMAVRRLLPVECERLQGFPTVEKTAIIEVCTDLLKSYANAVIPNHKWPELAGIAAKTISQENASSAQPSSLINDQRESKPVPNNVLINCEGGEVGIVNSKGQSWFVNNAESAGQYHLPLPVDDFVQVLVGLPSIVGQIIQSGREELPQNGQCSITQKNGVALVRLSGNEIMQPVVDALKDLITHNKPLRCITSDRSDLLMTAQTLQTLSLCAALAIFGFTPERTSTKSFLTIRIRHTSEWTDVPRKGKPTPDGPRYKANR